MLQYVPDLIAILFLLSILDYFYGCATFRSELRMLLNRVGVLKH